MIFDNRMEIQTKSLVKPTEFEQFVSLIKNEQESNENSDINIERKDKIARQVRAAYTLLRECFNLPYRELYIDEFYLTKSHIQKEGAKEILELERELSEIRWFRIIRRSDLRSHVMIAKIRAKNGYDHGLAYHDFLSLLTKVGLPGYTKYLPPNFKELVLEIFKREYPGSPEA